MRRQAEVGELFRLHGEAVFRFCRRMVRRQDLADDLLQQVFVQALRDHDSFRGHSSRKTWLFAIAKNRCLDALRSKYIVVTESSADSPAGDAPAPILGRLPPRRRRACGAGGLSRGAVAEEPRGGPGSLQERYDLRATRQAPQGVGGRAAGPGGAGVAAAAQRLQRKEWSHG